MQQVVDAVYQLRVELDLPSSSSSRVAEATPSTQVVPPSASIPAMMVFAELFLGGYGSGELLVSENQTITPPIGVPMATASSIIFDANYHGSQWLEPIRQACKDNRVGVVCGYSERAENTDTVTSSDCDSTTRSLSSTATKETGAFKYKYFNAALVIDDNGVVLASYRKVHLWGGYEASFFSPADQLLGGRFPFHGISCGVLICFDVEFPESTRTLRLDGAEVVFVPTALVSPFNARVTVPSRAFENNFVVCYANEVGQDPHLDHVNYCGLSVVALPDGTEGCRAAGLSTPSTTEGVNSSSFAQNGSFGSAAARSNKRLFEYCVIDLDDAAFAAARSRNNYLDARRPVCYAK